MDGAEHVGAADPREAILAALEAAYAKVWRTVMARLPVGPIQPAFADLMVDATEKLARMAALAASEDPATIPDFVALRLEIEGNLDVMRRFVTDHPDLRESLLPVATVLARAYAIALLTEHRQRARGQLGVGPAAGFYRAVALQAALQRRRGLAPCLRHRQRIHCRPRRRSRVRRHTRSGSRSPGRAGNSDPEPGPLALADRPFCGAAAGGEKWS